MQPTTPPPPELQNGRHGGGEGEEDRYNESLLGLLGLCRRLAGLLPIEFLH